MALIVQKYGGTSVGSVARIQAVARRVSRAAAQGQQLVVVVSAMSGETDRLLRLAGELAAPGGRELDVLLASGEQVSMALLGMALAALGLRAQSFTGGQARILTDDTHNKARIAGIDAEPLRQCLAEGRIGVVAGFQGVDAAGNITTLGRGGSDTTAVAVATALQADECQIYTDVDGVYTADPRIEPAARRMQRLSYEEMLEMASLGSKVLQIRAVEFASKYHVPLRVLSSFTDGEGTLISDEDRLMEAAQIAGIAHNRDEAKLTVHGVPDTPGIASQILGPIAAANIDVDMIIQNTGLDGTADFTFTVHRNDFDKALKLLDKMAGRLGGREVSGDKTIVKLSVIGVGMRSHAGIASAMFKALADEGINIQMIATSEIKISVVIAEKYLELGVRTLHAAFGLHREAVQRDELHGAINT